MSAPHDESLATRASLLDRLKDWGDRASWEQFFEAYWQLIYRVALKSGLTESEAQDAVQETVLAVAKSIRNFNYNPERCSFKSWLMLLSRQRIIWQLRKRLPFSSQAQVQDESCRSSTLEQLPDPDSLDLTRIWDEQWRDHLLTLALQRVKLQVGLKQFQIFDLYVLQNWQPSQVAQTLRIGVGQVYLAKFRVGALVKREIRKMTKEDF